MDVSGRRPPDELSACLAEIAGVVRVVSKPGEPSGEEQP